MFNKHLSSGDIYIHFFKESSKNSTSAKIYTYELFNYLLELLCTRKNDEFRENPVVLSNYVNCSCLLKHLKAFIFWQ